MVKVKVKIEEGAVLPKQAHKNDVGIDLYTNEAVIIMPGMVNATIIKTGLHTQFNAEKYGLFISPRSSMAKLPITLANSTGIIEGTYTGEIGVPIRNTLSMSDFSVETLMTDHILQYDEETKTVVRATLEDFCMDEIKWYQDSFVENFKLLHGETAISITDSRLLPTGSIFIPKHTRLVQAYIVPRYDVKFKVVDELEETERGDKGFGSSGASN